MNERESKLEFLRTFLAARDVPCPMCRYNLRGLTAETCPECGSEVEVTVGLTEPRMAAFIAGLIGLAAGLGFNALILGWIGVMSLSRMRGAPPAGMLVPLVVGVAATGLGMVLWLRSRRRIRQAAPVARRVLVALCYALSLGISMWFFVWAR